MPLGLYFWLFRAVPFYALSGCALLRFGSPSDPMHPAARPLEHWTRTLSEPKKLRIVRRGPGQILGESDFGVG